MKIFIIISVLILVKGCTQYYYIPTSQNVPLFKEKNEVQASFGLDNYSMKNFQGAYSITNHIGVQTFFMHRGKKEYLYEGGLGYYFIYAKYLAFETYTGFGHGIINANLQPLVSFNRLYIQPSIGFTSKILDVAFTPRFTTVHYTVDYDEGSYNDSNVYFMDNNSYNFFEPGVTLRLGYKYVKLQYQFVSAVKLTRDKLNYLETNNTVSIFITLPLNKN